MMFLSLSLLLAAAPLDLPERYLHQNELALNKNPWWQSLNIIGLSQAADRAQKHNGNAQSSRARLQQSEALANQLRGLMFPSISADASIGIQPITPQSAAQSGLGSTAPPGVTLPDFFYSGRAALSARYVADITGKNYLNFRAQKRSAQSQRAEHASLVHGLIQQSAAALLDLASSHEQLALLEAQLKSSSALSEVIELRYRNGQAQSAEVLQQQQQVANQKSQLPNARAQVSIARRRLASVLGEYALPQGTPVETTLPAPNFEVPSGQPNDLLTHRAELWSGARRLDASRDAYGVAWRNHIPTLTLSGNYGIAYNYVEDWNSFETWGATATLSVPLFTGLSNLSATQAAKANVRASEHSFEQQLRNALIDTENALEQLKAQEPTYIATLEVLKLAQNTYDRAKDSYLSGVGSYLATLTALRSLQNAEINVVRQKRASWGAIINAHAAVSGPWIRSLGSKE